MAKITENSISLAALALQKPSAYGTLQAAIEKHVDSTAAHPHISQPDYKSLLGTSSSIPKLEKHIDDYRNGYGNLSKEIARDLAKKGQNVADGLSLLQPKALSAYQGYLSTLEYGARARFVSGVDRAVTTSSKILGSL